MCILDNFDRLGVVYTKINLFPYRPFAYFHIMDELINDSLTMAGRQSILQPLLIITTINSEDHYFLNHRIEISLKNNLLCTCIRTKYMKVTMRPIIEELLRNLIIHEIFTRTNFGGRAIYLESLSTWLIPIN